MEAQEDLDLRSSAVGGNLRTPDVEPRVGDHPIEVAVGRQHDEVVPRAQPRQERLDHPDLNPGAPARVADLGRRDVVVAIEHQQRERSETLDDHRPSLRSGESLE